VAMGGLMRDDPSRVGDWVGERVCGLALEAEGRGAEVDLGQGI